MKISTLLYTLKQGFVNIVRNKLFSLASMATIAACLFVFGILYSVVANFQNIVHSAEEGVCITVFFMPGTSREDIAAFRDQIEQREEVVKTDFTSEEAGWEMVKEDLLADSEIEFSENPLENAGFDRLDVYLNDVSKQEELAEYARSMEGVRKVNSSWMMADTLSGVNMLVGYVSVAIIAILLAVSIFLISNTVSIGISVRKEEINIMKYIGATDFFVRSPFVLEGMLIGLIGAAIPLGMIYALYDHAVSYVSSQFPSLSELLAFLPVEEIAQYLTPVSLIVGVGIGFLGSLVTVRKHLRV